ncbi:barstar family protein [Streptomyces sp. NPDC016845]|uniref:barstar family protein n=1 Tax=Streptomyces sp. NPDC016845 TaxID=3364972 RepID=UPI0037A17CC4
MADTVVLDLDGAPDKAAFMERCATVLALPNWFGRNWDALADCLSERELVLVVTGWQGFAARCPREWATARAVFGEAPAVELRLD